MMRVRVAEAFGQQRLDARPDELGRPVTERLRDLGIRKHDGAAGIDDHRRVGRQIEESAGQLAGKIHYSSWPMDCRVLRF